MSKWISTDGLTDKDMPDVRVVAEYRTQFFGKDSSEYAVVYYDNPNDYVGGDGQGWLMWYMDIPVEVIRFKEFL